jgi:glycosyltransferase involved in cell wall biosynthesis
MSKIKILAVPPDAYAVGKFRITNPYIHLQENYSDDFHVDLKNSVPDNDDEFKNYDIIILHSFIHDNVPFERNLERIEWLKKQGKIVIVDIDDFWEPDFRHPMHLQIKMSGTPKRKVDLLKAATYVTTTTSVYRDTIKQRLNLKNVFVFPNAIDETESQFIPKPVKSDKIRFGWLGGSSHLYDIELLRSGIGSTYSYASDKTQFLLCGFDIRGFVTEIDSKTNKQNRREIKPEETVWFQYEKIFTENYKMLDNDVAYIQHLMTFKETDYDDIDKPYRRRWTKDITKYATNYNNFDVSLAPLVDSVFNNNKSQLKAIEAGFHKKAFICSESNPYLIDLVTAVDNGKFIDKGNSLLVSQSKNHKQWGQHMKRLIDNPNMIEDLGNRLYETVKDKYSLNKVNKDRVEFLKSIINN